MEDTGGVALGFHLQHPSGVARLAVGHIYRQIRGEMCVKDRILGGACA